jgi:hypothetical protein
MQINKLVVFGDSKLVVQQVKGSYQTRHPRMKAYKNKVWDMVDNFYVAFNISIVLREFNKPVDSLVVASNTFKVLATPQIKYDIKMRYRPSIPDNIKYSQYFEDDQQIKKFMEVIDEFSNTHIDPDHEEDTKHEIKEEAKDIPKFRNHMVEHKVLQLKNNFIPKGLMPLEKFFDINDVPVKPTVLPKDGSIEEYNIGTEKDHKYIKLSKNIPTDHREEYLQFFKEYMDVFSWIYEDLKTYDTSIIQHRIPLKLGTNPFRKNLKKVNHLLFPTIEKEVSNVLDSHFIIPLIYYEWVANLVPVRKKSGEITLCVDFKNLNKCI